MPRFRSALGRLVLLCLVCQGTALGVVPSVLWAAATGDALACTCAHGDHSDCPMHHPAGPGSKRCTMRGVPDGAAGMVVWLLGPIGLPSSTAAPRLVPPAPPLRAGQADADGRRAAPPDPPPPRQ